MLEPRVAFHLFPGFVVIAQAEDELDILAPPGQEFMHNFIVHDAPATAHNKHGRHVGQAELLADFLLARMRPEIRVNRDASHLDFGMGHAAVEQLALDLGRGHEISVNLGADPRIMRIVVRDHRTEGDVRAQPFQSGDDRTRNEMGTHNNVWPQLPDDILRARIEDAVQRQCRKPVE